MHIEFTLQSSRGFMLPFLFGFLRERETVSEKVHGETSASLEVLRQERMRVTTNTVLLVTVLWVDYNNAVGNL